MKFKVKYIFTVLVILISSVIIAQNVNVNYSKVKIDLQNIEQIKQLASDGLILDHPYYERSKDGFTITAIVNSSESEILSKSGLVFESLIEDVKKNFRDREKLSLAKQESIQSTNKITGFEFGSMGGFYNYDEVLAELDSMKLLYPNLITIKKSIGLSNESRDIWAVKISDNPDENEDEPELLYTSLHHAREPQSMMTVIYFMYYLLENYGSDPEVTYLIDNRELHFIPVVNPDRFIYNENTDPSGGGMWRKNRKDLGDDIFGVDLNRNYGFKWGLDNVGSSSDKENETYRGDSPFSEPETEAIKKYCENNNFKLALNYHSYSNLLIYPWGYSNTLSPDSSIFIAYAREMTKYNKYTFGTGYETVGYLTNGEADDWMYGEQTTKNKILSMTPEVGSGTDGFWPLQSRIFPLAEENIESDLLLAHFAGGYLNFVDYEISELVDNNGYLEPGEEGILKFSIKNFGQGESETVNFSIVNSDSFIIFYDQTDLQIPTLSSDEEFLDSIKFSVSEEAPIGSLTNFIYNINQNGKIFKDTIGSTVLGEPNIILFENADSRINWEMKGDWGINYISYYSKSQSFTDSPIGNYNDNSNSSMTLKKPIDVSNDSIMYLEYWTKWDIEVDWDFAQVFVSTDSVSWKSLKGQGMVKGSGKGTQSVNQFGYSGFQSKWIKETIDISNYAGNEKLYLRFKLSSDEFYNVDGWYIDDILIKSYLKKITDIDYKPNLPNEFKLEQNHPNPFNPSTIINYSIPTVGTQHAVILQNIKLIIYDVLGKEVTTLINKQQNPGNYKIQFDASNLSSGVYYYRLKVGDFVQTKKMILLK